MGTSQNGTDAAVAQIGGSGRSATDGMGPTGSIERTRDDGSTYFEQADTTDTANAHLYDATQPNGLSAAWNAEHGLAPSKEPEAPATPAADVPFAFATAAPQFAPFAIATTPHGDSDSGEPTHVGVSLMHLSRWREILRHAGAEVGTLADDMLHEIEHVLRIGGR